MIHNIAAFLSLSPPRVSPPRPGSRARCSVYPGWGWLRLRRQKQSRIRHNRTSPEPEPEDINNIIFLVAGPRITMIEVSVPTLCRGKDWSLVKCPRVQPDIQYFCWIFIFSIQSSTDIICPRRFLSSPSPTS